MVSLPHAQPVCNDWRVHGKSRFRRTASFLIQAASVALLAAGCSGQREGQQKQQRPRIGDLRHGFSSLWVFGSDRLQEVGTGADEDVVGIKLPAGFLGDAIESTDLRKVTIDHGNGIIWALEGRDTLRAYDLDGELIRSVQLPSNEANEEQPLALAVDSTNSIIWVAIGERLFRVAVDDEIVTEHPLNFRIRALKVEHPSSRLWVATQHSLFALDHSGSEAPSIPSMRSRVPQDIAIDR